MRTLQSLIIWAIALTFLYFAIEGFRRIYSTSLFEVLSQEEKEVWNYCTSTTTPPFIGRKKVLVNRLKLRKQPSMILEVDNWIQDITECLPLNAREER